MLINKKFLSNKNKFWAGILLAQFVLFYIFSKSKIMVSLFDHFFEIQKKTHQLLFSWIPFSVGDILYIILGIVIVYIIINLFRNKERGKVVHQFLVLFNVIYFLYQIFWGMLYFQKPLIEKLPKKEISSNEVKKLSLKYLNLCIELRKKVTEDKNGVFKINKIEAIKEEILENQNQLPIWLTQKKGSNVVSIKPSLFGEMMNYSGILGYYNPFTAEAQYNPNLPSSYIPFTMAHESAHQIGFAREQEANFIAYLIGKNSDNIELNYSTHYFVLKSLLNYLEEKDPDFVTSVLQKYPPGMQKDRNYERKYVIEHQGWLDLFFGFTNDIFLKSNQQEGSITYSYFIHLLVRFESK